ncbi:hypothetical protein [Candidatus Marithrix sp. Canyon 246]|uniref:hypothetical protein n=1 Tax=Candidatus Marithrix sp. Canyon 246 TaxID=1827136 RepID=UPI00114CBCD8|nr:hypothetical protein [Candidatus Marithrix sp. Canyon 246]
MKHRYINLSISFIIAIMVFVISPATIADTQLYMLDSSANNSLFSDQDIISVHHRRYRRHYHRRYTRFGHRRRYHRHPHYKKQIRHNHRKNHNNNITGK